MAKERDKAKLQKELFLKKLEEMPVISAVCTKTNIPKANIYRWKNEDPEFKSQLDEIRKRGIDNMCDVAEYQLFKKIQEGNLPATKYFLSSRHPDYIRSGIDKLKHFNPPNQFNITISQVGSKNKKYSKRTRKKDVRMNI